MKSLTVQSEVDFLHDSPPVMIDENDSNKTTMANTMFPTFTAKIE